METKISVEGMTCQHCKMTVENALKTLAGVKDAVVNLEEKSVVVSYEDGKVNLDSMRNAITESGYTPIDKSGGCGACCM